jgi:diguanylate cyclase (GGDEF)-like protein
MVRQEDTVARLGGDEFVLVLWHLAEPGYAATVARKVIEALSQPFDIEGNAVSITTSAGVGIYPVHGEDADTLTKSADLALYEAKRAGKNLYRISERTNLSATMNG